MTDEELAAELNIPVELVPKLSPEKRAAYECLVSIGREITLWEHGIGPLPPGVIICKDHRR